LVQISFYSFAKVLNVEKKDGDDDKKNDDYVFHILNLGLSDLLIERSVTFL